MTVSVPIAPQQKHAEPEIQLTVPFWRRRDWQLWRTYYLDYTPANRRGAWVQAQEQADDSLLTGGPRSRVALVPDIFLGGIVLRAWYRYEPGTLLRVRVWDDGRQAGAPMLVRVLHIAASETEGEWLLSCAFIAEN